MNNRLHSSIHWAIILSGLILVLIYYWFAIADRYAIFLYGHLGATPFDAITSSRYWMSGLVAAGGVLVLYTIGNMFFGYWTRRRGQHYQAPPWYQVWLWSVPVLGIGIPAITMTANSPTLPFGLALTCSMVTLIGLALALLPGRYAVDQPIRLAWLAVDGLGLLPLIMTLPALELPARGILSVQAVWLINGGSVIVTLGWLWLIGRLRRRYKQKRPTLRERLIASSCWGYLLMPLTHHLLATPPNYRYITAAGNFFASNPLLQLAIWGFMIILAWGTIKMEQRLFV